MKMCLKQHKPLSCVPASGRSREALSITVLWCLFIKEHFRRDPPEIQPVILTIKHLLDALQILFSSALLLQTTTWEHHLRLLPLFSHYFMLKNHQHPVIAPFWDRLYVNVRKKCHVGHKPGSGIVIWFNMDPDFMFILETGLSLMMCLIDCFFLHSLEIYERASIIYRYCWVIANPEQNLHSLLKQTRDLQEEEQSSLRIVF